MSDERSFPNAPESVTNARRYATNVLAGVAPDVADAIAVMVSEPATNAVRHAGTDFTVTIDRDIHGIRVAVTDTGAGLPALRSPAPTDHCGRGLRIVEALADKWGFTETANQIGKTVWFTVALASRGTSVDA
jgi:anti-sigma regulatory factor (Ser/Thr protein kinase)